MSPRRILVALLGLLACGSLLLAALDRVRRDESWALLERAMNAPDRVSFAGEAAWRVAHWHRAVRIRRDAERRLTEYRWGKRWRWTASRPSARTPDPTAWCLDFKALRANYRARTIATTHLLGRTVRIVELEPRFEGRPSVRLALDRDTALPLRVETFRADGTLYRATGFRTIRIGPQHVERRPGSRADWRGTEVPAGRLEEHAETAVWWPEYVPEGFGCIESRVRGRLGTEIVLLFSDGVTAFEITQRRVHTPAFIENALRRRFGARGAQRWMARVFERRMGEIVRSEGSRGGKTAVLRRRERSHCGYKLRVDGIEFELKSRSDLAGGEILRVLRSLRPR